MASLHPECKIFLSPTEWISTRFRLPLQSSHHVDYSTHNRATLIRRLLLENFLNFFFLIIFNSKLLFIVIRCNYNVLYVPVEITFVCNWIEYIKSLLHRDRNDINDNLINMNRFTDTHTIQTANIISYTFAWYRSRI